MSQNILRFNGQRFDPVSGTTHLGNGYREYSPLLMRFNCPDSLSPFGAGGVNPYAYCAGDPINRSDPGGHHSFLGWLGIATGIVLGALFTPLSGGTSLALSLSAVSAVSGMMSAGLAMAQQFVENFDLKAAAVLGWAALATGIVSGLISAAVSGLAPQAKSLAALLKGSASRPFGGLMMEGEGRAVTASTLNANAAHLENVTRHTLEKFAQNHPDDFRLVLNSLSGRDLDRLRVTSTTMFRGVEDHLMDLSKLLPQKSFGRVAVVSLNTAELTEVEDINPLYLYRVREIALGMHPFTTPSQLYRAGINPLSDELMLTYGIDAYENGVPIAGPFGDRGFNTSDLWISADHADSLFKEAWLGQFR